MQAKSFSANATNPLTVVLFTSMQEGLIERLLVKYIKDETLIQFFSRLLTQANISHSFAPALYFGLCEVLGTGQTLGEEFAGVHRHGTQAKRILWIILHASLLRILGERISRATGKIHLSVFLLNGKFLYLADRMLRVQRQITAASSQSLKFPPWLRYIFAGSLAVQGLAELSTLVREKIEAREFEQAWNQANVEEEGLTGGPDCTVCMAQCRRPTAAKCGHVFCWSCAILSFGREGKCPSCRAETSIQELFPLEHYSLKSEPVWKIVRSLDYSLLCSLPVKY